jgi:NifB/MoaA-like Fe-S oxidoreductase
MLKLSDKIRAVFPNISINVYRIKNNFFGESITVSGLLTGKDIIEQLTGKALGDALLIPANCLRSDGDVLLDDISPEDISKALGVPVIPAENSAECFIANLLGI